MEPTQKYSQRAHYKRKESELDLENEIRKDASLRNAGSNGSEDRNPARNPESSDKVIEDTALLAKMENCQPEVRPLGASPNLTCRSNIVSNITHKPIESINPKDSSGIPQGSTEGSPQGTDQSYTWQTPTPARRAKGDPLVFDISINSIKKLMKRLLSTNPKRPQEESNVTFPTNSRSFEETLESVINELPKLAFTEGEEGPPRCIAEEETSTKDTEESSDTSSEFHYKMDEPVSMHKNPLLKRKSKMASNGHPENSRPSQPMGNMSKVENDQEELRHK
eukprot:Gb_08280 [translate_table: standard]